MEATTVAAQGTAETSHDHAGFNLTLSGISNSPTAAKRVLADGISELSRTLETLKSSLSFDFVKNSLRTSSNVQQKYEWEDNKQMFRGYEVNYNLSFEIDELELVSKVYDALTSLSVVGDNLKVNVGSPWFTITPRTRDRLNKKALKKAWEKVEERFETECDVLGLDPTAFEVATWEVSYSDSRRSNRVSDRMAGSRSMMSSGPALIGDAAPSAAPFNAADDNGDTPLIEIQIGQATVTVNLEVGFARKASATTVKAVAASNSNRTTTTTQSTSPSLTS